MSKDWQAWHQDYDDPHSSLARRLAVVRQYLADALQGTGPRPRLISMCGGDGRDMLPVLAELRPGAQALLVELDPELAARARSTARMLGLAGIRVVTGDAGTTGAYVKAVPADVVLACGVFGNVPARDVRRTISALPALLAPGGTVIWTRGRGDSGADPSQQVRGWFADTGFDELALAAPDDARYRVGMHRLARPPDPPVDDDRTLFRFA